LNIVNHTQQKPRHPWLSKQGQLCDKAKTHFVVNV